jgi:hypothetical protein
MAAIRQRPVATPVPYLTTWSSCIAAALRMPGLFPSDVNAIS